MAESPSFEDEMEMREEKKPPSFYDVVEVMKSPSFCGLVEA